MSYLLDKKIKRNNFFKVIFFLAVLLVLIYFRSGIWGGLSNIAQTIFRPVLFLGNGLGEKFKDIGSSFYFKKSLMLQNEDLKLKLNELEGRISNYNSVLGENTQLKEILGRKNERTTMVLAGILSRPNQSMYDTLLIDAGAREGIAPGDVVFALGNVPVGMVSLVYQNSSTVILFSNPGEKTNVLVPVDHSLTGAPGQNISMQLIGRGGGNFEMTLLRDFNLPQGTEIILPGATPLVVAVVKTIISDPRDSFQKALLASPVNIQGLKFVEIAIQR